MASRLLQNMVKILKFLSCSTGQYVQVGMIKKGGEGKWNVPTTDNIIKFYLDIIIFLTISHERFCQE